MKKQLEITEISEVRSGTNSKGNDWTLYQCSATDGKRYKTFKDLRAAIGRPYWFEVVSEKSDKVNPKTGEPYVNLTIVDYTEGPVMPKATDDAKVRELEQRIEALEIFVGLREPKA